MLTLLPWLDRDGLIDGPSMLRTRPRDDDGAGAAGATVDGVTPTPVPAMDDARLAVGGGSLSTSSMLRTGADGGAGAGAGGGIELSTSSMLRTGERGPGGLWVRLEPCCAGRRLDARPLAPRDEGRPCGGASSSFRISRRSSSRADSSDMGDMGDSNGGFVTSEAVIAQARSCRGPGASAAGGEKYRLLRRQRYGHGGFQ